MIGEDYLKIAASNIRRAAQVKQQHARELRGEADRLHHDINHQVDALSHEKNRIQTTASNPDMDSTARALLIKTASDHQKSIDSKRDEMRRLEDELKRQIDQVERQIQDLLSNASSLERQWGV